MNAAFTEKRAADRRAGDALQATATNALHRAKQAEQQRDEFKQLLVEAHLQLPLAAAHWNQNEDDQLRTFHVQRVLSLVSRIAAAISPVGSAA